MKDSMIWGGGPGRTWRPGNAEAIRCAAITFGILEIVARFRCYTEDEMMRVIREARHREYPYAQSIANYKAGMIKMAGEGYLAYIESLNPQMYNQSDWADAPGSHCVLKRAA